MRLIFFPILFLLSSGLFSQTNTPVPPLYPPLELTSNFAEYRRDHFHGGLDLRVMNKADQSVFSIWDGYVSRVRFNAASYGRAIYITHPNGYISVYGHLDSFIPAIDSVVKAWQYKNQQFDVDIAFEEGVIAVKQGQKIGVAGNSGYSFGAHLHFEIRKNKGETPINPAVFYDFNDNTAPVFNRLYIYTPCQRFDHPYESKNFAVVRSGKNYMVPGTVLIPDSSYLGFDVQDFQTGGWSRLLPYSVEVFFDDSLIWHIRFDEFNYDETKACASVFDHEEGLRNKKQIIVTKKAAGNRLSMYKTASNNGFLIIKDENTHKIRVKATDTEQNSSELYFSVKHSAQKQMKCNCRNAAGPEMIQEFITENIHIKIDTYGFIDKYCLDVPLIREHKTSGFLHWDIGNSFMALAKPFRVEFTGLENWPKHYVFAQMENGKIRNAWLPQKDSKGTYYHMLDRLGTFSLIKDSIAPEIKETNVKNGTGFTYRQFLTFEVEDNSTEIPKFNAWINDEWVLMTYDYKNDLFSIELNREQFASMKNLKVEFYDLAGNKSDLYFDFLKP